MYQYRVNDELLIETEMALGEDDLELIRDGTEPYTKYGGREVKLAEPTSEGQPMVALPVEEYDRLRRAAGEL